MKIVYPRSIKTDRLHLRIPTSGDAFLICDGVLGSLHILKPWLFWVDEYEKHGLAAALEYISYVNESFSQGEEFNFSCFFGDQLVGGVGLIRPLFDEKSREKSIEVGYWVVADHAGHGYMTEAANAVTRYAFGYLGVKKVFIICDRENKKSSAVARRLHFSLVETGPHLSNLGRSEDAVYEKFVCVSPDLLPPMGRLQYGE